MLARTAATRRATTALPVLAAPRIVAVRAATRQIPRTARSISFWPFQKKIDPSLPVYFPKETPTRPRRAPWKKVRYAIVTALVYYALFQVYMTVVLDPLLDWAEAEWDSLSEKEKQELEEQAGDDDEEPILFLPFPFTTKKVPQPPYKGSDPEWKEFIKINKDQNTQKEIRANLAETIRRRIEGNPAITRLMGPKPPKIRKYWLDITYPPRPPEKHYISGLILDWDGLFWGDRSIETMAANQLDAIMYPKAVALSVWTFWNVLVSRKKDDISKALGFDSPKEPETSWQSVLINRGGQPPFGPTARPPTTPTNVLSPPQSESPPKNQAPQQGSSMQGGGPLDVAGIFKKPEDGGSTVSMSPSMAQAFQAATLTLTKNWKTAQQPVQRGCIRVDGLVELQGSSALMTLVVVGWYDPQTKKYVKIDSRVKNVMQFKQKPQGGP